MYNIIVTNYGNLLVMNTVSWLLASCFVSFYSLRAVAQAFFTYRLGGVSGHWWLAASLWAYEIIDYGLHMAIVVFATKSSGYMDFKEHYNGLVYVAMFSSITVRSSTTGHTPQFE
jgi:hypothetical protein